jgi:exodeoxyribonuclease VII large subunit
MEHNEKTPEPIFSVSEYIEFLNINLKKIGLAKIEGEVTKITIPASGHAYFSIKDKSGIGVLDCIIWKSNYFLCGVRLEEGMEVILSGYPDIYPPSGRISFKAQTIELKGEGALKKAYEELKNKLESEGLFSENRKKKIPAFPEKIGVITSKQGAVIHDFLSNIGKYGFSIKMIDSRVEGQEAIKDLLSAIRTFKKKDIDVLVVIRGGGSLESLQPFNNETLVREIVNFPVPVIAGIGHDKDVPLFTLAADVSESTPTAVANLLNESWDQALFLVERHEKDIINLYSEHLSGVNARLNGFVYKIKEKFGEILYRQKRIEDKLRIFLLRVEQTISSEKKYVDNILKSILNNFSDSLNNIGYKIKNTEKIIASYDPERQLKLGYSIARHNGAIIKLAKDVKIGEAMDVQVSDGSIRSKVENIIKQ